MAIKIKNNNTENLTRTNRWTSTMNQLIFLHYDINESIKRTPVSLASGRNIVKHIENRLTSVLINFQTLLLKSGRALEDYQQKN